MLKIDILTLFPQMFTGPFAESIVKRAVEKGVVKIQIHDLRDWATDTHKTVDDRPYGGGAGMILKVDLVDKALKKLKTKSAKVILLDAGGETLNQKMAASLSRQKHLILIAGHYEGVDHRVHEHLVDEAISIGNFVLTGGEIPAMAVVDAVIRLLPGVIDRKSLKEESFSQGANLEYPQYTRPEEYNGWRVPEVLLSGNHKEIEAWREQKSKK